MIAHIRSVSRETVLLPVHAWRLVSVLLPPRCKYHPTCSAYALDAVRTRGIVVGSALTLWRIVRCNPWSYGGYDPVAPRRRDRPAHRRNEDATSRDGGSRRCSRIGR